MGGSQTGAGKESYRRSSKGGREDQQEVDMIFAVGTCVASQVDGKEEDLI